MSKAVVFQYEAAPTEIFGEALASRYSEKYHALIPGIDLAKLEKHRLARAKREKEDDQAFVILQVGTVCDRKNQALMIEALERLQQNASVGEIRLQFAGGVFEEECAGQLRGRIAESGLEGTVEWLGWRDDIHDLMEKADLLVMPSKGEGVPNTVQEAMYIGLPVVVSEAGGMPEAVTDGETGWVVSFDEPGVWADRIGGCARDPDRCRELGAAASQYAGTHFGTESWGAEYAGVIRSVQKAAN